MKCPICKSKNIKDIKKNKSFPFCSSKCKDIDLYNWLSGEYTYFEEEDLPIRLVPAEEGN